MQKKSDPIPSNMVYNDLNLTNPSDIVNSFAEHFAQSFINRNPSANLSCSSLNKNVLNIRSISEGCVYKAIKKFKPKMARSNTGFCGKRLCKCVYYSF